VDLGDDLSRHTGAPPGQRVVSWRDVLGEFGAQAGLQAVQESYGEGAAFAWREAQPRVCPDGELDATADHVVFNGSPVRSSRRSDATATLTTSSSDCASWRRDNWLAVHYANERGDPGVTGQTIADRDQNSGDKTWLTCDEVAASWDAARRIYDATCPGWHSHDGMTLSLVS
jgi:hypothetical protein